MPDSTRPSLMQRLRDPSDQRAWEEFDQRYRQLILRYCLRRGLQHNDAEDVRQVVLMSLARVLPAFDYRPEVGRFRDYLARVVRNAIARRFSRPSRLAAGLEPEELDALVERDAHADASHESDVAWEQEWMHHHYRLALVGVRESFEERSVALFERLLAGESVQAVARDCELSEQAVHKVKQRIKKRLAELIRRQIHEEEFPQRQALA